MTTSGLRASTVVMPERLEDWSPASVFGPTTCEHPAFRQPARDNVTDEHNQSCRVAEQHVAYASSDRALGRCTPLAIAHCTSAFAPRRPAPPLVRDASEMDAESSQTAHCRRRRSSYSSGLPARPLTHSSTSNRANEELKCGAAAAAAAAQVIQRQVRLLLLRRCERVAHREVEVLRSMLQRAAATLLVESYRRYRSRRAIDMYLHSWWNDEIRVQALLMQLQFAKRERKCCVAVAKRIQQHQQLRGLDAARRRDASAQIARWFCDNVLLRQHRKQQQRAACCIQRAYRAVLYRRAAYRRHIERQIAAARTITDCAKRVCTQNQRLRRALEVDCAVQIQRLWRRMIHVRAVHRQRVVACAMVLSVQFYACAVRDAFARWTSTTNLLRLLAQQQQRDASDRVLKRAMCAWIHRRRQKQRYRSALRIQLFVRGAQARQRVRDLQQRAKQQREHNAAVRLQCLARGWVTRKRFAKRLKQLRERFRCANCGVIEPCGTYCKRCGRKRTTFESVLLLNSQMLADAAVRSSVSAASESYTKTLRLAQAHLVPTRPTALLQIATVSTTTTTTTRNSSRIRHGKPSKPAVAAMSALPIVLSPRHAALTAATKPLAKTGHIRRLDVLLQQPYSRSERAHSNQHDVEVRKPHTVKTDDTATTRAASKIARQTTLRAQALVALQTQQQEVLYAQTLEQHLHRLQKASHAVRRSR